MNASRWTRVLLACAALLLGLTLLVPIWRVDLTAPQYPEGLGMRIWAHTVSGAGPNDLQNINGLNHYIGMKTIEPDAIAELHFMPWGIGAMAALGLAFAAFGRKRWIVGWTVVLVMSACVGLVDFWKWEYDYGHHLDLEHAPITIPGMSYQPPLIGTKQLLNFTATSLPDVGGVMAVLAVVLAVAAVCMNRGTAPTRPETRTTKDNAGKNAVPLTNTAVSTIGVLLIAVTLVSCDNGPRAILSGADACAQCRMTIDDPRFAGQVKTVTGKIETFDSIECLVSFVNALPATAMPRNIWVSDAEHPGRWIAASSARFVRNGSLHSPMGRTLAAFDATRPVKALLARYGGEQMDWKTVQQVMLAEAKVADAHVLSGSIASNDVPSTGVARDTVVVDGHGAVRTIAQGVANATRGGVVLVRAGIYREPTIEIRKPLTLVADTGVIVDGEEMRELLVINADSVTVRGFRFENTGTSQVTDRAAVHVIEASACSIEHNQFVNTLFGIYLQHATGCRILENVLTGRLGSQTVTGNGIHLWSSRDNLIEGNVIRGHRDAIYFEFVRHSIVRNNLSEESHRYGLHFMFSDSCRYEGNTFRANQSGVAVMYSHVVAITGNRFADNRGPSTYGLLLKEITDSDVRGNVFADNSIALHLEGASRNTVADNDFVRNGWALRVLADAVDNRITGNAFSGNLFDMGTNSRTTASTVAGNYWDRYRGYDLDHNGIGDVPHAPVRLFALLVAQSPAALLLVRSAMVDLLDIVERVVPALTPVTLTDSTPLMHAPRRLS